MGAKGRVQERTMAAGIGFTVALLSAAILPFARGQAQTAGQPLQLTISAESPGVEEPFPVRLTLHFRNLGNQLLWLYKPVRDAAAISESSLGPSPGGSTVAVRLEAKGAPAGTSSRTPAVGTLLRTAGMPHPQLIQIAPGGSYQERVAINIAPAQQSGSTGGPVWGTYQISVVYSASYSNGATINSALGVDVWQGSVSSNQVQLQVQPSPAANGGSISGTVINRQMQQVWGMLVSLSDSNEHVIAQMVTGNDGGFGFSHLPYGRYWVTVRTPGSDVNAGFFEHADLSASNPDAKLKLIMLNPEDEEAKQSLHKPVLFRLKDNAGNPVAGAILDILWSSGTVLEQLRAKTDENGLAELNLIPGSNYVTIRRRHCPKQEEMAAVAAGHGIDGFVMTVECGKQ